MANPKLEAQSEADIRSGLTAEEARLRLERDGRNELPSTPPRSVLTIVRAQLSSLMVLVLLAAAAVSTYLGDAADALVILAIVALNTVVGARQELQAERDLSALRKMARLRARVRREGHVMDVDSAELVRGDLLLLEAGDAVPADARLLEAFSLRVDESALTGQSEPSDKSADAPSLPDAPLGDRTSSLFLGTTVVYGRGVAVVAATGAATELGKIADMMHAVKPEPTPLQRRLSELGRLLVAAALLVVALVFALGLQRGEDVHVLFLTAVSLAVAAVPEGLPAMVTVALALGSRRMLARNALIRRLSAVEALGSVTVICSDKTGTLTQNRMTVRVAQTTVERLELDKIQEEPRSQDAVRLLISGALANDAVLEDAADGSGTPVGDPTEVALLVAAAQFGFGKERLEDNFPRIGEAPFDSERKRMATAHQLPAGGDLAGAFPSSPGEVLVCAKGAVDRLLEVCTRASRDGEGVPLDEELRASVQQEHDKLAESGMRVLAVGYKLVSDEIDASDPASLEQDLIYLGLLGMIDPPREEARSALDACDRAGIRTVMITGDHPKTARAIASQLGIGLDAEHRTGMELSAMTTSELERDAETVRVYARVSPEHKLRIVDALQSRGHLVAMTGDGVNDAPALEKADIGVAMGLTGSDAAREASDMVLRDDNFATIVAAVEEGRVVFDNLRKFVQFLLTANTAELWVMLVGPLLGMPLPLAPLQILWMNLVTDGPPALALAVEPAEEDVLNRPPRRPRESVFAGGVGVNIAWMGLFMGATSLAVGWWYWSREFDQWQTMLFTTLTWSQLALALSMRSLSKTVIGVRLFSNPYLVGGVAASAALQAAVVYAPPLSALFGTTPLENEDLGICLTAGVVVFGASELSKTLSRLGAKLFRARIVVAQQH